MESAVEGDYFTMFLILAERIGTVTDDSGVSLGLDRWLAPSIVF
jgi:hypothetical protein